MSEPSGGDYEAGGLDGQGANTPDLPANGGNKKRASGLGRPAFSALFAITTPMLFLLYVHITATDVLAHRPEVHNSTMFGPQIECEVKVVVGWLYGLIQRVFPSFSRPWITIDPQGASGNEHATHAAFVRTTLFTWSLSSVICFGLSLTRARRHLETTFVFSVWTIFVGSVPLALMLLSVIETVPFSVSLCAMMHFSNAIVGFGFGGAFCTGVPLLMGFTRPEKHPKVHHLLGGVAPFIILGHVVGMAVSFYLLDRNWILAMTLIQMTAPIPYYFLRKRVRQYLYPVEIPRPQRKPDFDTGIKVVSLRVIVLEIPEFVRRRRFYLSSLLRGALWSTVDLAGQIFRLTFGLLIEDMGEPEEQVVMYSLVADVVSITACVLAFLINVFLIARIFAKDEEMQHKINFWKLLIFGILNCAILLCVVVCDVMPGHTPQFLNTQALGWPFVLYSVFAALSYETLFEFLPAIIQKREEYLTGWCLAVVIRLGVQLIVLWLIDLWVEYQWPLWAVVAFQLVFHAIFAIFAGMLHKHEHDHDEEEHHAAPNVNAPTKDPEQVDDDVAHDAARDEAKGTENALGTASETNAIPHDAGERDNVGSSSAVGERKIENE